TPQGTNDQPGTSRQVVSNEQFLVSDGSGSGGGTGGTNSTAKPKPETLLMNQFGLSDDVQTLGQEAVAYSQGKNSMLTQDEINQLKNQAQTMLANLPQTNPPVDDDVKALQNFLNILSNYPTTNAQSGKLLMTQQGLPQDMIDLGQYAEGMLDAQGGWLTPG